MSERPILSVLLLALVAGTGCATKAASVGDSTPGGNVAVRDIETRITQLEQEEVERRQRLDALDAEIEQAKADLDLARKETDMYRCSAKRALVRAEIIGFRSQCVQKQAEYESCVARNSASTAKGTAFGCLIGLGAAIATGGAAAPATLAGCGGGALTGKAANTRCGNPPNCVQLFNNIEMKMVGKHRLDRIPHCTWNGMSSGQSSSNGAATPASREKYRRPDALAPRSRGY